MTIALFSLIQIPAFLLVFYWFGFYFFTLSFLVRRAKCGQSNKVIYWLASVTWGCFCLLLVLIAILFTFWIPDKLGVEHSPYLYPGMIIVGLIVVFIAFVMSVRKHDPAQLAIKQDRHP